MNKRYLIQPFGFLLALLTSCGSGSGSSSMDSAPPTPSFERTESRESCDDYDPFRSPHFGDLHAHSAYSADAFYLGTAVLPDEVYRFAMGEPLGVPGGTTQLRRPLDFAAVTDHAEHFALGHIPLLIGNVAISNSSFAWQDMQRAAETFYDRTTACRFTTFIGYEYASTSTVMLHRNVIFRNDNVPNDPISMIDTPTPQGLWAGLREKCLDSLERCDVLAIPHNSNLSQGVAFDPRGRFGGFSTAAEASSRASMEPLVEVYQAKGDSECRTGVLTRDEMCSFEKLNRTKALGESDPDQVFEPLSFVRNVLKEGLVQEEVLGTNPYQLGMIGSTDSHNGMAGATNEEDFRSGGLAGGWHSTPAGLLTRSGPAGIEANPGGLAVVWAEENSRDALFAALRRREVYATSGTRPIVRFFGGEYQTDMCDANDFAARGYAGGAPMGGVLRGEDVAESGPSFAVLAFRDTDPGAAPLQRLQIVKGWIDADGEIRERVFEVAGDSQTGATVDPATCTVTGDGFDSLCAVWRDPTFQPMQRSFYYARVLENPTCRWNTFLCNELDIDCNDPAALLSAFETCCDETFPRTIQERAWTSPIWYRP